MPPAGAGPAAREGQHDVRESADRRGTRRAGGPGGGRRRLLDGGATVPFIARYRKEATGSLDDAQLRLLEERLGYLRDLRDRRAVVLESIRAQGKLTRPWKPPSPPPRPRRAWRTSTSHTRPSAGPRPRSPGRRGSPPWPRPCSPTLPSIPPRRRPPTSPRTRACPPPRRPWTVPATSSPNASRGRGPRGAPA